MDAEYIGALADLLEAGRSYPEIRQNIAHFVANKLTPSANRRENPCGC